MQESVHEFFFVLCFCILRILQNLKDHRYEETHLQGNETECGHLKLMNRVYFIFLTTSELLIVSRCLLKNPMV